MLGSKQPSLPEHVITLPELIGTVVVNPASTEELGRVKEVVCSREDHSVRSLILTRPGESVSAIPCSVNHLQGWDDGRIVSTLLCEATDANQRLQARMLSELRRATHLWWPQHVLGRVLHFPAGKVAHIRDFAFTRSPLAAVHILCEENGIASWTALAGPFDTWTASVRRTA